MRTTTRRRPALSDDTPLRDVTFVAFDTETTGLSPLDASPIELAGVRFRGDGEVLDRFGALCDPDRPIPRAVTRMTGISRRMLRGQPPPIRAIEEFLAFVGRRSVLVAHNAAFDVAFVADSLRAAGRRLPPHRVLDSMRLAEPMGAQKGGRSLRRLAEQLGLDGVRFHRAAPDAERVREIVVRTIDYLEGRADGIPPPAAGTNGAGDGDDVLGKAARALLRRRRRGRPVTLGEVCAATHAFRFADVEAAPIEPPPELAPLGSALARGSFVSFEYGRHGDPTRTAHVRPISIYRQRERGYLIAYCPTEGAERSYRLDRIQKVAVRPDR